MDESEKPRKRKNRPRQSSSRIATRLQKRFALPKRKNSISWPLRALRFSPQLPKGRPLLVPSLSTLKRPLGMAFEYLVRAQLQRINPLAVTGQWLAEEAIYAATQQLSESGYLYAEADYFIQGMSGRFERVTKQAKDPHKLISHLYGFVEKAKVLETQFIKNGLLNRELLESYLKLSRLHGQFVGSRAFVAPFDFDQVDPRAVHELEAMFDLVSWDQFKAKKRCLLRPQFRSSSDRGRFEPDLVIDDMIIDLKALESRSLDRRDIDQLLLYFALAELEGFKGRRKGGINKLALYFSRFADWLVIDLRNDYSPEKIEKFIVWHRKRRMPKIT